MSDHAFPPPPEAVRCPKCLRGVVIASTPRRILESDCAIHDCPIRNNPDNQVGELSGTSISFAEPSEISQEGRIARFTKWEKQGLDRIKADLLAGGHRLVGGPPAVRDLAWEWVRMREAEQAPVPSAQQTVELFSLKPNFHGVGIDLKEAWRRILRQFNELMNRFRGRSR